MVFLELQEPLEKTGATVILEPLDPPEILVPLDYLDLLE